MAMFDLKDSEDIKLTDCHTDSSTLVRGERLKRLEVSGSSALARPVSPMPPKRSILGFFVENLITSLLTLVVSLIAGYLLWRFGWAG